MRKSFSEKKSQPHIAIACGGTGGHLFPGLAVGEELARCGCAVTLLISPKDVDQQAVKSVSGMAVETLPAVALTGKNIFGFAFGFLKSFLAARKLFKKNPPAAVLAMGGFTSAPPVFAGKFLGAKTFLHESNTIPGKANRWLARFVDEAFVYFPETASRLHARETEVIGMPVRPQFLEAMDPSAARRALGLEADRPVLLVMGGSQGASGINDLILSALPLLTEAAPEMQFLHLTGVRDFEKVKAAYTAQKCRAVVRAFLSEMDLALGAATVAVSRSGASSLAELAATKLPSILIPYPTAADNHQFFNAVAFAAEGAASIAKQTHTKPERVAREIVSLMSDLDLRRGMKAALAKWHTPDSARQIAQRITRLIGAVEIISEKNLVPAKLGNIPSIKSRNALKPETANV